MLYNKLVLSPTPTIFFPFCKIVPSSLVIMIVQFLGNNQKVFVVFFKTYFLPKGSSSLEIQFWFVAWTVGSEQPPPPRCSLIRLAFRYSTS